MIGKLRHSITFQSKSEAADGVGGYTTTWADGSTVWARIEPVSARERMFSGRLEKNITHKIRIRYLAGIDPSMRIKFGSRIFQIHGIVTPSEITRWLDILSEEGPPS